MFEYISSLLKNFFKKEESVESVKEKETLKYITIDTKVTENDRENSEIELDEKDINYKNFIKKRKYKNKLKK